MREDMASAQRENNRRRKKSLPSSVPSTIASAGGFPHTHTGVSRTLRTSHTLIQMKGQYSVMEEVWQSPRIVAIMAKWRSFAVKTQTSMSEGTWPMPHKIVQS